jgi:hypothetical protein
VSEIKDPYLEALQSIAASIGTAGLDQQIAALPAPQVRFTHSLFTELRFGLGSVAFNQPATQLLASKLEGHVIKYAAGSLPPETKSLSVVYPAPTPPKYQDVHDATKEHEVDVRLYAEKYEGDGEDYERVIPLQVQPLAVEFFNKSKADPTKAAILVSFVTR